MRLTQKIAATGFIVASIVLPVIASAQTFTTTVPPNLTSVNQIYNFTGRILGYLQTFFWVIAAIVIVLAAYKYLTAGGDEDKVKSAKQMIIYAVIAIVVALVATAVVGAVRSFLG